MEVVGTLEGCEMGLGKIPLHSRRIHGMSEKGVFWYLHEKISYEVLCTLYSCVSYITSFLDTLPKTNS